GDPIGRRFPHAREIHPPMHSNAASSPNSPRMNVSRCQVTNMLAPFTASAMRVTRPLLLGIVAAAFSAAPAVADDTSPILKEGRPAVPTPQPRPRLMSAEVAAELAAKVPKFEPAPSMKPAEPSPDLRETDKPKNTIIRLPQYLVQERKLPPLKEREM